MKHQFRILTMTAALSFKVYWSGTLILHIISVLGAVGVAVTAAAQRAIVDATGSGGVTGVVISALLGAVAFAAVNVGRAGGSSLRGEITERVELRLTERILSLTSKLPTIEHLTHPAYLDRITLLRAGVQSLAATCWTVVDVVASVVSLALSAILLADVHPGLALLAFFGLPPLLVTGRTQRLVRQAAQDTAEHTRREQRIHDLCIQPQYAPEIRISGGAPLLNKRAAALWSRATAVETRAVVRGAMGELAAWLIFAIGVVGTVMATVVLTAKGNASVGDIVLVITLATQLRVQVFLTVHNIGRLAEAGHVVGHYIWLEDYAGRFEISGRAVPERLTKGITLSAVAFSYPETDAPVLHDVNVHMPAGSVVGLVGVNGAGKSTMVQLLTGMFRPTQGSISVDGIPLGEMDPALWRGRASGAFQDFVKFQFLARETVGIGDLDRLASATAVQEALARADAAATVQALESGLDTQLGHVFNGAQLSHGQWQKLALARGLMRRAPLLLVFDEPTAALDPQVEHDLFERFITYARATAEKYGTITVLVSHRFSTVHMADHVVVLRDGTVGEQGTHAELMARGGLYAELFLTQSRAYA